MDERVLRQKAKTAGPANEKLFRKLKKQKPSDLDTVMQELHEEVFAETDCLQCANCCKTTSPTFYQKDIERLARHFRITPSKFIEQYLHIDEDQDYVLNSAPCTFLGADNYCSVYEARPNACREYPHTDRKRFHQILDLTLKNSSVCPAVYDILERLKKVYQ
ncbi:MAG: YkgJ family cysteine cluster protein [Cytophagaceae bacterium]